MQIAHTIADIRSLRRTLSGTVAFVPTMGALHDGHASLLKLAKNTADHLVVSIFLNPSQFGPNEDLASYPTSLTQDLALCEQFGASLVFLPTNHEMYPHHKPEHSSYQRTNVHVHGLGRFLCGASRPTHFDGVTTVVSKLFNLVQPDFALFGQKDYQQLAIIRQMVADLNFPVKVIAAPTSREPDGLARSSRNLRLTPDQRLIAPQLAHALADAWNAFHQGETNPVRLTLIVMQHLSSFSPFRVDYVTCINPYTLQPLLDPQPLDPSEPPPVIAVATYLGSVRLIDNINLGEDLPDELQLP